MTSAQTASVQTASAQMASAETASAEAMTDARRPKRLLGAVLREVVALVVVVLLGVAVLGRMLGTEWLHYFLYDGDSLALPLLLKSVAAGEPFQWIMTSQLLIFPEAPLYVASAAIGRTPQLALLINAILNIVVFYGLSRSIAGSLLRDRSRVWRIVAALAATLTLLLLIALEARGLNNVGALATTYLLTTYYYGVIVSALAGLALALWYVRGLHEHPPTALWRSIARGIVFAIGMIGVTALTTLSNPLFLLQFVAPFVVAVLALLLLRRWSVRDAVVVLSAVVIGALAGTRLRELFSQYIAADAGSYFHLERANDALNALLTQVRTVGQTGSGKLELLLVGGLLVVAVVGVVVTVYAQSRPEKNRIVSHGSSLVFFFVTLSSVSLLVGQIITGSLVSRYLLPLATFTPLVVVVLVGSGPVVRSAAALARRAGARVTSRASLAAAAVVVLAAGVLGGLGTPTVVRAANDVYVSADQDCLSEWLDGRSLSGVGSFWTTRPLALYGSSEFDVQQVNWDFSAQLWMSNLHSFEGKHYTYALVDHAFGREPDWTPFAETTLGEPRTITRCDTFDIYDYAGTPGESTLNRIVDDSISRARAERGI